jgi:hypothetical protein
MTLSNAFVALACYSTYMPYVVYSICNNMSVIRFPFNTVYGLGSPTQTITNINYHILHAILHFTCNTVYGLGSPTQTITKINYHILHAILHFTCNTIYGLGSPTQTITNMSY